MKAGLAVTKIDQLRPLLEKHHLRLVSAQHLYNLIPFVREQERAAVKAEVAGRELSVIFDRSTRLSEAVVIIVRFAQYDEERRLFVIKQRIVSMQMLAKSLNAQELARELVVCLANELQVTPYQLLAVMRDGVAVNGAALAHLKFVLPTFLDVTCFAHTIDNVGKHFDLPTLDAFSELWVRLFSHSPAAKLRWQQLTGKSMRSYSPTRWWSRWEVHNQCLEYFGDIELFLQQHADMGGKTCEKLVAMFADEESLKRLKVELAIVVDLGVHLVKATYLLEGDGPLFLKAYEILQGVSHAIGRCQYTNLHRVCSNIAADQDEEAVLKGHAKAGVRDAVRYFLRKFNVEHVQVVRAFKAARLQGSCHLLA